MALATYSDLQAAIASWLGGRSDLSSNIPDFVKLFEAAANRRLRVRAMETATSLTTSGGSVALPSDFLEPREVAWLGASNAVSLEYVHPTWNDYQYPTAPSGIPSIYYILDGNIYTIPFNDTSQLQLIYYKQIPALASNSTNWLLTAHPDAYLFGSLAESAGFTQDDNALAKWVARRDAIFEEIETLDKRGYGIGGIKIIGSTP